MSEIFEKAVWAICKAIGDVGGMTPSHDGCRTVARAMIAAIREPSGDMCQAALLTAVRENKGIEYSPYQGWQAMIDAMLREADADRSAGGKENK